MIVSKWRVAIAIIAVTTLGASTALANHVFTDVDDGRFYAEATEWAKDNGITTGCGDGTTFCPEDPVTRGENVTFAKRYHDNVAQPALDALDGRLDTAEAEIDTLQAELNTAESDIDAAQATADGNTASLATGYVKTDDFEAFGPADTDQTVIDMALPAGNYIVTATLVANNNAAGTTNFGCSLTLGGTVLDDMNDTALFPNGDNTTPSSRESVGLTGGGMLAAGGSATVVCQTDTGTGNWLGISITAIRVSSITTP